MKRFVSMLIAALMLLSMTGAFAVTVTEVAEFDGVVSVVSGTNLMHVRDDNGGYALMDVNGNRLTGADYYYDFYQHYGHLTVTKVGGEDINATGLLALDGTEEVPFRYGDVEVLNEYWAVGVKLSVAEGEEYDYNSWTSDDKYLIESADVYYLPEKKLLTTLTRDQYADAEARGHYINIEDRQGGVIAYDSAFNTTAEPDYSFDFNYLPETLIVFYGDNSLRGVQNGAGETVIEPAFEYLSTDEHTTANGLIEYEEGDKYGLIDLQGNVVVPAEYDDINTSRQGAYEPAETYRYVSGGYICVEKDGKLGYVDAQGNETCKPSADEDNATNYGMSALVEDGDKYTIHAADGVVTKLSDYESVYVLEYSGGRFYKVRDADYNHGVIDWHGEIVLPLEYDSVSMMGDGQHALVSADNVYKVLKIEE